MSDDVVVKAESKQITLSLNGSELADEIVEALPFETQSATWGKEIYFAIPVEYPGQETTSNVSVGDVAYWPEGCSLAIFYGKTPMSEGEEPVPPDDVQIVGSITEGLDELDEIDAGEPLKLSLK